MKSDRPALSKHLARRRGGNLNSREKAQDEWSQGVAGVRGVQGAAVANKNSVMKREAGFYCSFASLALLKTTGILNKPDWAGLKTQLSLIQRAAAASNFESPVECKMLIFVI